MRIRPGNAVLALLLAATAGCGAATEPPPARPVPSPSTVERQAPRPSSAEGRGGVETSGDTEGDLRFAEFVAENSGGMVQAVASGIERKGLLRVVLGRDAEPEDTLPLTKAIVAGARKDFDDKPFTLSMFDPGRELILKARFEPGDGVRYELAGSDDSRRAPTDAPSRDDAGTGRGGDLDRRFSAWAMKTGGEFLRYVEADLERNGRIWFGITPTVEPADVPDLTKSLLEGASTEFPGRAISAVVFDPEGERIGRATLGRGGRVEWER